MLLVRTPAGNRNMEAGPLTLIGEVRRYAAQYVFNGLHADDLQVYGPAGVALQDSDVLGPTTEVFVTRQPADAPSYVGEGGRVVRPAVTDSGFQ